MRNDTDNLPVDSLSEPYRGWHYYPELVVTPRLEQKLDFTLVDGPSVYFFNGLWHMLYFGYDGTGYQSCLAVSNDLIHWEGRGLVMGYGKPGCFDHGGTAFVGPLYDSADIRHPRTLKKWKDRYWVLYGSYPEQGGYELGAGAQGLAWSGDGYVWHRYSESQPVLSTEGADSWENRVIYSPCIVERDDQFTILYNAKGTAGREQIGAAFSRNLLHWKRYQRNPVIENSPRGYDALLAANPRVYRDGDHWIMFYFGASRNNPDGELHAHIMTAFSRDLVTWTVNPEPLYRAGGHPAGLDSVHAHNVSLIHDPATGMGYMFYCAAGDKGRGIGLLTEKPVT